MKKTDWDIGSSAERTYFASMRQFLKELIAYTRTAKSAGELVNRITTWAASPEFKQWSWRAAFRMVESVATRNAKTWREAAQANKSRANEIHRLLKAETDNSAKYQFIIKQNAKLIRSLPIQMAERVTKLSAEYATSGIRASELANQIMREVPGITERRAKLIARTEVSKAQEAINQSRAEEMGVSWYQWETSQDERVRSSHAHMQGVWCKYSDPPAPEVLDGLPSEGHYNAGQIFNCRCYAAPIIELELETFPAKVYYRGNIVRMSRRQFKKIQ